MRLLAVVFVTLVGIALAGCASDECEKLRDLCGKCKDPAWRETCYDYEQYVRSSGGHGGMSPDELCEASVDMFSSCR
jgi:hypothetical protein